MSQISDELRRVIETGSKSRYQLWQETGVDQAQLSRFMHGTCRLGAEQIEKLAEALGFELILRNAKQILVPCDQEFSSYFFT